MDGTSSIHGRKRELVAYKILVRKHERKRSLERPDIDGRVKLKWMLRK
jgi:hypothetical protein